VILTSGSDQTLIDALAERLGLPGPHFGSDGQTNLTGRTKAERLVAEFGSGRFDYVGNATVDLAIWREARRVISIAPSSSLARELDKLGKPVETVGRRWNAKSLLRGMRPHQWLKNLLLLLPLLAAHAFSLDHLVPVLLMIVAFSATASSVYLVNDLFDLATDRVHPEKRFRPIASGELPISVAMAAAAALALTGLAIAAWVGVATLALMLIYVALTLTYSAFLKRIRWVDMIVLASLYTIRVITGAAAAAVALSGWLIALCLALFFTLTAVKRLGGLSKTETDSKIPGRGYTGSDRTAMLWTGYAGAAVAALVYLAYSFTDDARGLYSNLLAFRLAAVPMFAWTLRLIRLSRTGLGVYDPVVFVTQDRIGLAILLAAAALWLLAL
jgi:4-hydroxybenzoate polyprenyltransferase